MEKTAGPLQDFFVWPPEFFDLRYSEHKWIRGPGETPIVPIYGSVLGFVSCCYVEFKEDKIASSSQFEVTILHSKEITVVRAGVLASLPCQSLR